ncbi:hypothetical protein [Aeromonas veronii]|uniref:hypothetical protein n=1 Tax=Aeromonas veronii TaxID=654 RepID=UPI001116671E|nr:hypothetical protein [Aeromonas veronii]
MDIEQYVPSQENTEDKVHRTIRAAIGLCPLASGTLLEAFNMLWKPPAESRAEKWMSDVINVINQLAERQNNIDILINGEEFQSLLISANQLVLKHHQPEKIKYFRNAVINGITCNFLSYDKKITFINILDQLTISHVKVMSMLKGDGVLWGVDNKTTEARYPYFVSKRLFEISSELFDEHLFIEKIVQDLSQHKLFHDIELVKAQGVDVVRMGSITNTDVGIIGLAIPFSELPEKKFVYQTRLNDFGVEFLEYITNLNLAVKA